MNTLATLIIRFRIFILISVVIVTAALALALPQMTPDDDLMKFLPQDAPDIQLFNRVNKQFGGLDVAIIGLESHGMITRENIALVREITRKVAAVDGVYDVLSFTEIPNPQPAPDGLRVTPLVMDKIPQSKEELAQLKKTVLQNKNAVGNLISKDGRAAMILCFLGGDRPPIHTAADIKTTATSVWKNNPIYFGGSPFIRLYVAGGTQKDLVKLTPLVALVVLIVTFIIFRRPVGVLLALGVVGIAIIWLMGAVALRGNGLTIVGSSLPTILMAIGGAYGVHILAGYFNGTSASVQERIEEMLRNMGPPVIASGATTAAGFLSFLAMDIAPLRDFGVQAAAGVSATAILAITAIPAILSFQKTPPTPISELLPVGPLGAIGAFAERRRIPVIVASIALAAVSMAGITRIAPDATLESFFSDDSEPAEANKFLVRHFGGSNYVQIYFEGDMRSPFVLFQLQKIVEYTRSLDEVEQVSSITDSLIMMSEAMGGRADVPMNNRRAGSLYPFLEGTAAIDQMISKNKDASLVQVRFANVDATTVQETIKRIRLFIAKEVQTKTQAVQVGAFSLPNEALAEYSTPVQKDGEGNIIRKAYRTHIDQSLSSAERTAKKNVMQLDVSKRLVRLAKIHDKHAAPAHAAEKLHVLFQKETTDDQLSPGADLDNAVRETITEHITEDYAFLDIDEVDEADAAGAERIARQQEEWNHRFDLVFKQLSAAAIHFLDVNRMSELLKSALPLTTERDPEGLALTAKAMALSFAMRRSVVKADRLLPEVLTILQIKKPSAALKNSLRWAITDLDMPVYGFPSDAETAAPVLASVTGAPVINVALCNSTINNQLKSLFVAVVVLLLVLSILFRSLRTALKGLVPTLLMLALAVGVMGAFKIPIDLSTSMIAAIALGIGVDYAIHFLWRRRRRGESLRQTTAGVGPSIAANAIQVASGFAVLCISNMIPMRRFGMLVALTMLLAALATFLLLPALRAEGRQRNLAPKRTLKN
ncbi:MAG: MMPL family transporter [Deltaproteobacteria bacterium]|nr:MMPL family transporter [Deltaproteobacteria bacterium]MBN2672714.1 MMPL family transporter [Deltaproteobacteria bacterium]